MPYQSEIFIDSNPRTVRDAGIAAAIGVALDLAMRNRQMSGMAETSGTSETPWMMCAIESMNAIRSGWQHQNRWGVPGGWKPVPGVWRNK